MSRDSTPSTICRPNPGEDLRHVMVLTAKFFVVLLKIIDQACLLEDL